MHGEYKVPGGKLVVVDLSEQDGRIAEFRLAGDFFLEPDEALGAIDRAVNGLPVTASALEIGEAIKAGLPADAVLLGFTPESVGVAIRRALQHASSFADYEWTIIDDEPRLPMLHVALDEVLTEEVGAGRRGPTLRFWNLAGPAVYLGSFQSYRNEVEPEAAARHGIPVLRRITGGGAMFSEPDNAITYSLYVPGDLVSGMSFQDSYAFLDAWVIEALKALGIDAYYAPLNDIASAKGKIGGAAQKRLASGAVLHHATMSYDIDADKMTEVLRIGKEKLSDKGTTSAKKRVDPLKSQTGMEKAAVQEALKGTFRTLFGGTEGALTPAEITAAEERIRTKFGTREWLLRVP